MMKFLKLMDDKLIMSYLLLVIFLQIIMLLLMILHVHAKVSKDINTSVIYVQDGPIPVKQQFYQEVAEQASINTEEFNCSKADLVRFTISVAYLETGAFKSELISNFNYFGIKSMRAKSKSFETTEYYKGKLLKVHQNFAVNNSTAESITQFFTLLKGQRYASVREADKLPAMFKALQRSGYATDPRYANKLIAISKQIFKHE